MKLLELLKGRKMKVRTDMNVDVELTIESVTENSSYVETGPSNAANDWYPDGYTQTSYTVKFTNGATKRFTSLSEIDLLP